MRTKIIAAALAGALIVGMGVSVADAARLDVSTAAASSFTKEQRCAAAMANSSPVIDTTTGTAGTVAVSNVPLSCHGLSLAINLHDASGALIASGTTASALGSQNVSVGSYTAGDVAVAIATVGGWIFPTDWVTSLLQNFTCQGLDLNNQPTGAECTLTFSVHSWPSGQGRTTKLAFKAETTAPLWQVVFDFSDTAHFEGWTPLKVANNYNVALAPGYSCSQLPVFVGVEANHGHSNPEGQIHFSTDPYFGGELLCG